MLESLWASPRRKAVVVLLMWFYLSTYAICIGAEINAELKHRAEASGQP